LMEKLAMTISFPADWKMKTEAKSNAMIDFICKCLILMNTLLKKKNFMRSSKPNYMVRFVQIYDFFELLVLIFRRNRLFFSNERKSTESRYD
jgi:hypothetical protein